MTLARTTGASIFAFDPSICGLKKNKDEGKLNNESDADGDVTALSKTVQERGKENRKKLFKKTAG